MQVPYLKRLLEGKFFFFFFVFHVSSFKANHLLNLLKFKCKLHHLAVQLSHCELSRWSWLQNHIRESIFKTVYFFSLLFKTFKLSTKLFCLQCQWLVIADYVQQLFFLPMLLECHCILSLSENSSSFPEILWFGDTAPIMLLCSRDNSQYLKNAVVYNLFDLKQLMPLGLSQTDY